MKFKLVSDLHLEFYGARPFYRQEAQPVWEPPVCEDDKDTVLLLPGDIHVGFKALPWLNKMCERFHDVVYLLGNHEFYNHEVNDVRNFWKNENGYPDNFTFLDDGILFIEGIRIIGGTLWTQVTDPHMVWMGPKRMTDYQLTTIREHGQVRKMNVQDTNRMHFETINYIRDEVQKPYEGKTIVMTHHLPHPLCVHERFVGDALNAFFMTDLDHIIRNFDIDVWCHGHTHNNVDVVVHDTRILCNPMGYHGVCLNQDFNKDLTFELTTGT